MGGGAARGVNLPNLKGALDLIVNVNEAKLLKNVVGVKTHLQVTMAFEYFMHRRYLKI